MSLDHEELVRTIRVDRHDRGTCHVLDAIGEFDLSNAADLVAGVHAAIEDGKELVVLDLTAVTLLDSAALHRLLEATAHAAVRDVRLIIVPARAKVHEAVVLAGIEDALPFVGAPIRLDA
jgi:anti-anti-sigma factor